ncbi:MAG: hypothetical protein EOP07_12295 [Proteobacteria bacterium]|nr:MAG: hypothetical protein EOP07_12295 [Pseudomonadota bacterium]
MSVLSQVRAATRDIHQSLDDHPLLVRFMSQGNVTAYQTFLQTFSLYLRIAVAKQLDYITTDDRKVINYEPWSAALQSDLETFEAGDNFAFADRYSKHLPDIENVSQYWGFLYVMEGSTLGGRQLAAMIPSDWPSEFLRRGAEAKLRWPYFCRRLGELEVAGAIEAAEVQLGADKAFRSMVKIFDKTLDKTPPAATFVSLSSEI